MEEEKKNGKNILNDGKLPLFIQYPYVDQNKSLF